MTLRAYIEEAQNRQANSIKKKHNNSQELVYLRSDGSHYLPKQEHVTIKHPLRNIRTINNTVSDNASTSPITNINAQNVTINSPSSFPKESASLSPKQVTPQAYTKQQSPIDSLQTFNHTHNIIKEHQKIQNQMRLKDIVIRAENRLSCNPPQQLTHEVSSDHSRKISLPAFLAEISQCLSSSRPFNPFGIALVVMGGISIATRGRITINPSPSWQISPNLWIFQFAGAGTGKSPVMAEIRKPFDDFINKRHQEQKSSADYVKTAKVIKQISDQELKKNLRQEIRSDSLYYDVNKLISMVDSHNKKTLPLNKRIEENRKPAQILLDSTTPTGLRRKLSEQGESIGVITSEIDFLDLNIFKKGCDIAFFNKLYDQEPFNISTAREEIKFNHPSLAMVNFLQTGVSHKIFANEKLNTQGFIGRILPFFHCDQNTYSSPPSITPHSISAYRNTITRLLSLYYTQSNNAEQYNVSLKEEAYEQAIAFEQELKSNLIYSFSPEVESSFLKLHGQAVRLAWCIHAWNFEIPHLHPITAEEMSQAIQLCRILIPHISYAVDPCGLQAYNHAIKIVNNLAQITCTLGNETLSKGYIESRTIQQRTHIKSQNVLNALRLLERHNWLAIIDTGKESNIVVLHPRFKEFKIT